jgi:protein AbiQ
MHNIQYCYIDSQYYIEHPDLRQILDVDDTEKHNVRTHVCLNIKYLGNNILIPLRKNLGSATRPFGKIGFPVPSQSKPNAGLDYRYIMVINESKYLKFNRPRISNRQLAIIKNNYDTIQKEATIFCNFCRLCRLNQAHLHRQK